MRNRKLYSHMYNGWRIKDALNNAVNNPDVVLREENRFVKSNSLLDIKKEVYNYLYSFEGGYRVKLTGEEAKYYKKLKKQRGEIKCGV